MTNFTQKFQVFSFKREPVSIKCILKQVIDAGVCVTLAVRIGTQIVVDSVHSVTIA